MTYHEQNETETKQYEYDGDFLAYMKFEPEPCLYVDGLCSGSIGKSLMSLLDKFYKIKKCEAVKLTAST